MLRVLIVLVSCCTGAVAAWLFLPTATTMAALTWDAAGDSGQAAAPAAKTPMMSLEKRRARAEQLIGSPLRYITGDEVHDSDWFAALDTPQLERAVDECILLTDTEFAMQHAAALRDEDADPEDLIDRSDPIKSAMQMMGAPSLAQLRMCKNAAVAYFERHGQELDF